MGGLSETHKEKARSVARYSGGVKAEQAHFRAVIPERRASGLSGTHDHLIDQN
jgi:hypothetical protein